MKPSKPAEDVTTSPTPMTPVEVAVATVSAEIKKAVESYQQSSHRVVIKRYVLR